MLGSGGSGALLGPAPGLELSALPGSLGCAADIVDDLSGVLGGSEMLADVYARHRDMGPARGGVPTAFRSGVVEQK